MMLDFLGEAEAGTRHEAAVLAVLERGDTLTPDLGGTATTREVAAAVAEGLRA